VALLVGGSTFAQHRVAFLLGAVVVFCLPAAAWYVAIQLDWALPPSGSSPQGLLLGTTAAAIIAVEMLLWPRKKLRGRRLGRTRTWMFFHVWLGVACLPLAVGHAGFRFGGLLPATVMILCLAVIFSGVWGLALQQRLPHKLLHDFPDETIEAETDRVMAYDLPEAERLVETAGPGDVLRSFYRDAVAPYLAHGPRSKSPLASASQAAVVFADWQARQPAAAEAVRRLREMCDRRRRYDEQARIHWWLHNWVAVHVPLSVALCVLLVVHIVTALKYW
ncbi:MAG TPA: hypothetical protein VM597_26200, partial [Gemmataceae bacterium]|nr:hypothetical protein [Gemmataceae bacterium]